LPGRTETQVRAIAEEFKSRPGEYREARDRAGITLERAYLQNTPMGDFVVAYIESERPFGETTAAMAKSDLAIDREFVKHVKEVHGVDLTQPPAGPAPENVGEWTDPDVSDRLPGKAFCAPLLPGVTDAGRAFAREAFITRIDEITASRRELDTTVEVVTLLSTPHGDITSIYTEGKDPQGSSRKFAASTSSYDKWFKEKLATLYPPQMDFNEPSPEVTEIFDSTALLVAR